MRRRRRKKKNSLLFGEKVMGVGIMMFLIFGSALDGPGWIFPLIMTGVGVAVTGIGIVIAEAEGSEYV